MPHHRPRASDFDEPARNRGPSPSRSPSPPPPRDHDHGLYHRRPSPNYDRGNHLDQRQRSQRLTPEESLDRYSKHHSNHYDSHQHQRQTDDQSRYPRPYNGYSNGYRQGGRDDFFESRRLQRENAQVHFWPESPLQAYGEAKRKKTSSHHKEDHRHHKSRDHKKHKSLHHHKSKSSKRSKRYQSDSESDRSERRKHRSRTKHKSSRHHEKSRAEEDDCEDSDDSTDEEEEREKARRDKKRKEKSKSIELDSEEVWIEKEVGAPTISQPELTREVRKDSITGPSRPVKVEEPPPLTTTTHVDDFIDDEQDDDVGEVGPMPYNHATGKAMDPKEFGRALRPGEGSAMAAFIEAGERIPRRGEIGLTGNQIEKFENVGYVMSGSRHRRMNAVRIRKENQVISAEEKRGILKMQAEEKAKREGQIISSFRELVDTKLQESVN